MSGDATVTSLQAEFAPLTEPEARLVLVLHGASDESRAIDEIVAQVKSERCGPAVGWEAEYAAANGASTDEPDLVPEPDAPGVAMDPGTKVEVEVPTEIPDGEQEGVPDGTVAEILDWVGEDQDRARKAIDAELSREDARSTLLSALEPLAGDEEVEP